MKTINPGEPVAKIGLFLLFAFCAALAAGPVTPALALNACQKEAAQCNRIIDVTFRQEKRDLGDRSARKLEDRRRFECRAALKKCGEVKSRNRDLRLGPGGGGVKSGDQLGSSVYNPRR